MQVKKQMKQMVRRMVYGQKANSDTYIRYLRSLGMQIGEYCEIYTPTKTTIDTTRPWMISIGENVKITQGVTILTHGFDWSVIKNVYGDVLGSSGKVSIGNNVFIGMNSTILKGVHIGNNVIIGANSLVNKNLPDNVVAAGNPCRVIMSLEDYYEKRKAMQIREAKELVCEYRKVYDKDPGEKALHEFFWLFRDGDEDLPGVWKSMMEIGGGYHKSMEKLQKNEKKFQSMADFLEHCKNDNNEEDR